MNSRTFTITRRAALLGLLPAAGLAQSWAIAPGGMLRVAIITSSPVLVTLRPDSPPGGVSVGLADALATMLGVPMQLVPYADLAGFQASLGAGAWDIGIAARDPAQAAQLVFSEAFMEVDNLYVARPGLPVATASEVDRPGIRVAVAAGSATDGFLTRTLRQAEIIRVPAGLGPAREALAEGRADVYAEDAQLTHQVAAALPGARVLPGRFNMLEIAVALPRAQMAGLVPLNDFIRSAKDQGLVARLISEAGLRGARQAP